MKEVNGLKIANLTPHSVNILAGGEYVEIPTSGYVLRVAEEVKCLGFVKGIKIIKKDLKDDFITCEDLSKIKEFGENCDIVVVSLLAGKLVKKMYEKGLIDEGIIKKYFVIGEVARDEKGRVIGADSLAPVIYL